MGVLDLRTNEFQAFGNTELQKTLFEEAQAEAELVRGAGHSFARDEYLSGRQTPVFFGSALNDFGVREVLDALVEHAPEGVPWLHKIKVDGYRAAARIERG